MKKPSLPSIIGAILCALLLPVAALNIALAAQSYLHPDKVATVFGLGPLIVETGSMRPEFAENDLIIMKRVDATALEKGDIIAFYDANGIVVSHRIIGYGTDENGARAYITKGDANNVQDSEPVPAARVVGTVTRVFPGAGKAMRFISQPYVTALAIAAPIGIYMAISKLHKTLSGRKKREEEIVQNNESHTAE